MNLEQGMESWPFDAESGTIALRTYKPVRGAKCPESRRGACRAWPLREWRQKKAKKKGVNNRVDVARSHHAERIMAQTRTASVLASGGRGEVSGEDHLFVHCGGFGRP